MDSDNLIAKYAVLNDQWSRYAPRSIVSGVVFQQAIMNTAHERAFTDQAITDFAITDHAITDQSITDPGISGHPFIKAHY